jgi:hypothetical protein
MAYFSASRSSALSRGAFARFCPNEPPGPVHHLKQTPAEATRSLPKMLSVSGLARKIGSKIAANKFPEAVRHNPYQFWAELIILGPVVAREI